MALNPALYRLLRSASTSAQVPVPISTPGLDPRFALLRARTAAVPSPSQRRLPPESEEEEVEEDFEEEDLEEQEEAPRRRPSSRKAKSQAKKTTWTRQAAERTAGLQAAGRTARSVPSQQVERMRHPEKVVEDDLVERFDAVTQDLDRGVDNVASSSFIDVLGFRWLFRWGAGRFVLSDPYEHGQGRHYSHRTMPPSPRLDAVLDRFLLALTRHRLSVARQRDLPIMAPDDPPERVGPFDAVTQVLRRAQGAGTIYDPSGKTPEIETYRELIPYAGRLWLSHGQVMGGDPGIRNRLYEVVPESAWKGSTFDNRKKGDYGRIGLVALGFPFLRGQLALVKGQRYVHTGHVLEAAGRPLADDLVSRRLVRNGSHFFFALLPGLDPKRKGKDKRDLASVWIVPVLDLDAKPIRVPVDFHEIVIAWKQEWKGDRMGWQEERFVGKPGDGHWEDRIVWPDDVPKAVRDLYLPGWTPRDTYWGPRNLRPEVEKKLEALAAKLPQMPREY